MVGGKRHFLPLTTAPSRWCQPPVRSIVALAYLLSAADHPFCLHRRSHTRSRTWSRTARSGTSMLRIGARIEIGCSRWRGISGKNGRVRTTTCNVPTFFFHANTHLTASDLTQYQAFTEIPSPVDRTDLSPTPNHQTLCPKPLTPHP